MKQISFYILLIMLSVGCNNSEDAPINPNLVNFKDYVIAEIVDPHSPFKNFENPTIPFHHEWINGEISYTLINSQERLDTICLDTNYKLTQIINFEKETLVGVYTIYPSTRPHTEYVYDIKKDTVTNEYLINIMCVKYGIGFGDKAFQMLHWFILPKVSDKSLIKCVKTEKDGVIEDFDLSMVNGEYKGSLDSVDISHNRISSNITLSIAPIIDKIPNIKFSYIQNGNEVAFSNQYIRKFMNRIEFYGEKIVLYGPPIISTNYCLNHGRYSFGSRILQIEFVHEQRELSWQWVEFYGQKN